MENNILSKPDLSSETVEDTAVSVMTELERRLGSQESVSRKGIVGVPIIDPIDSSSVESVSRKEIKQPPIITNEDPKKFIECMGALQPDGSAIIVVAPDKTQRFRFISEIDQEVTFSSIDEFLKYYRKLESVGVTPIFIFVGGIEHGDVERKIRVKQEDGSFLNEDQKNSIDAMSVYLERESSEDGMNFIKNCLESVTKSRHPGDVRDIFLNIIRESKNKGIDPQIALRKLLSDTSKRSLLQQILNLKLEDSFFSDLSKNKDKAMNTVLTLILFSKLLDPGMSSNDKDDFKSSLHYHHHQIGGIYEEYSSIALLLGPQLYSLSEVKQRQLFNKFRLLFKERDRVPVFSLLRDTHNNTKYS